MVKTRLEIEKRIPDSVILLLREQGKVLIPPYCTPLVCIKDFSQKFQEQWVFGSDESMIKKGWITYVVNDEWYYINIRLKDGHNLNNIVLYPENNYYGINFYMTHFKEYKL